MASEIRTVTIDCHNAYDLSQWWSKVLGYAEPPDDRNEPGHEECLIVDPEGAGPALLFIEVPDDKVIKNRLHLDISSRQYTRDAEAGWLTGNGATLVADHRTTDGAGWLTLADPEGNEFCIVRSDAERAGTL